MNPEGGGLSVRGVPESYRPGETYRLQVRVTGAALERGGFQLSARCAGDERTGERAGLLVAPGDRADVAEGTGEEYRGTEGVQYARHTEAGTRPDSGRTVSWSLRWKAPRTGEAGAEGAACGRVVLNVAGNVANGDASEFGDRIYLEEIPVAAAGP